MRVAFDEGTLDRAFDEAIDARPVGLTFDLDGTLYDARRVRRALLWRAFPRWRALRVGVEVREALRGRVFATGEALRSAEARDAAARLGLSPVEARALLDRLFDDTLTRCLPASPRLAAGLAGIAARGIALAVVSDRRIGDKLRALGLDGVPWRALVSADEIGVLKPSPTLFQRACVAMALPPAKILHIGDREDTDGAGARAAGLSYRRVLGPKQTLAVLERLWPGTA